MVERSWGVGSMRSMWLGVLSLLQVLNTAATNKAFFSPFYSVRVVSPWTLPPTIGWASYPQLILFRDTQRCVS